MVTPVGLPGRISPGTAVVYTRKAKGREHGNPNRWEWFMVKVAEPTCVILSEVGLHAPD
jgi:hypothetical protein